MKSILQISIISFLITAVCCICSCQKTSDSVGFLPEFINSNIETRFIKAVKAKTIYLIQPTGDFSENLLIASLQGLTAKTSEEQILINTEGSDYYKPYITENWDTILTDTINDQQVTISALAEHFKNTVEGYILCSGEGGSSSVNVAISLAGILNAVIATPQTEEILKDMDINVS